MTVETGIQEAVEMTLDGVADKFERGIVRAYIKELEAALNDQKAANALLMQSSNVISLTAKQQRQRAETAETRLSVALGADKPDKPATPTERARYWALEAAAQRERAEAAEAKLAAIPYKAIHDCWYHSDGQTPDTSADIVEAWLDGAKPFTDILASLYRIADAVLMRGEPLQYDLDVTREWMEKYPRV